MSITIGQNAGVGRTQATEEAVQSGQVTPLSDAELGEAIAAMESINRGSLPEADAVLAGLTKTQQGQTLESNLSAAIADIQQAIIENMGGKKSV